VWVQLHNRSQLPGYDFIAWHLVHAWSYFAILLVLSAAATVVLNFKSCAVSFLTMSFLMTFVIVLQATFLIVVKIWFDIPMNVPLTKGMRGRQKCILTTIAVGGIVGIALISFSFLVWGGAIFGMAAITGVITILWQACCRRRHQRRHTLSTSI